jgi:2-amino-4-hydroxy-6-hydroxymethyldihydropteridine diphosphokinase
MYYLIGLGSNINPEANIKLAQQAISEQTQVVNLSSVLINPPCGKTFHFPFHNQLLVIYSAHSSKTLKSIFEAIEMQLGREEKCPERKFNDRTIDIDILYQNESLSQLIKFPLEESYNQEIMSNWVI